MADLINSKIWLSRPKLICGVMTGTSLDSIDIAFARFEIGRKGDHEFKYLGGKEYKLPVSYSKTVLKLINKNTPMSSFSLFQVAYSNLIKNAVEKALKAFEIKEDIDAIAVHGQTLWHQPGKEKIFDLDLSHSLQAVSGSTLSTLLEIPVVFDFRAADIALGGNGAPLIPIFDYNFLKNENEDVICLNIGGISNITYIPKKATDEHIIAFDTGVGNILIDLAMLKFYRKKYDKNGEIAKTGKVNKDLLAFLLDDEYYNQSPPKSTGREKYNDSYFKLIVDFKEKNNISDEDLIATLTKFTSKTIAIAVNKFTKNNAKIIVSGGGRKNKEILYYLQKELPNNNIIQIDSIGLDGDMKEALAFAYIAWRSIGGMYSNLPAATGAFRKTRLGSVSFT